MKGKVALIIVFGVNWTIIAVLKTEVITIYVVLGSSRRLLEGKDCLWSMCPTQASFSAQQPYMVPGKSTLDETGAGMGQQTSCLEITEVVRDMWFWF